MHTHATHPLVRLPPAARTTPYTQQHRHTCRNTDIDLQIHVHIPSRTHKYTHTRTPALTHPRTYTISRRAHQVANKLTHTLKHDSTHMFMCSKTTPPQKGGGVCTGKNDGRARSRVEAPSTNEGLEKDAGRLVRFPLRGFSHSMALCVKSSPCLMYVLWER